MVLVFALFSTGGASDICELFLFSCIYFLYQVVLAHYNFPLVVPVMFVFLGEKQNKQNHLDFFLSDFSLTFFLSALTSFLFLNTLIRFKCTDVFRFKSVDVYFLAYRCQRPLSGLSCRSFFFRPKLPMFIFCRNLPNFLFWPMLPIFLTMVSALIKVVMSLQLLCAGKFVSPKSYSTNLLHHLVSYLLFLFI